MGIGERFDYAELYQQLFVPDPATTPEDPKSSLTPEQALWWAVLEDAIEIFLLRPRDRYRITEGEGERVRRWILSTTERCGGFSYACLAVKLDPQAVRKTLVLQRRRMLEVGW
jgi:hypothetical protein